MLPKCHDTMDVVELDKRYRHREDAVGSPKESYHRPRIAKRHQKLGEAEDYRHGLIKGNTV